MSDIGLPKTIKTKDDAYIQGIADGERALLTSLRSHGFFYGIDELLHCDCGWIGEAPFLGNDEYWIHLEEVYL